MCGKDKAYGNPVMLEEKGSFWTFGIDFARKYKQPMSDPQDETEEQVGSLDKEPTAPYLRSPLGHRTHVLLKKSICTFYLIDHVRCVMS